MLVIAIFADVIAPLRHHGARSARAADAAAGLGGMSRHSLGTDELGRDVLSRLIVSIRISLLIAFGATAISAVFGTTLGFLAAHFRGWVEQFVLMLIDFQASMPFLILALVRARLLRQFAAAVDRPDGPIWLGALCPHRPRPRHLPPTRKAMPPRSGSSARARWRIYLRHILPNIASTLIVSTTLAFPEIILLESGLSFLGLGVQPPMTSLGNMVGYGREYLTRAPWILLAPAPPSS